MLDEIVMTYIFISFMTQLVFNIYTLDTVLGNVEVIIQISKCLTGFIRRSSSRVSDHKETLQKNLNSSHSPSKGMAFKSVDTVIRLKTGRSLVIAQIPRRTGAADVNFEKAWAAGGRGGGTL